MRVTKIVWWLTSQGIIRTVGKLFNDVNIQRKSIKRDAPRDLQDARKMSYHSIILLKLYL